MFAVFLFGHDLNLGPKAFDFALHQEEFGPKLMPMNTTQVPLVPCTEQHYNFTPSLKSAFHKLNMSMGLCPPLDHEFKVKGKLTSDIFDRLRVVVTRCNTTADPLCANDSSFAAMEAGRFQIIVPFVHTNVNPGSENYREFYLTDTSSFSFSSTLGVCATA